MILTFITLWLVLYFIYRQIVEKHIMQKEIDAKTQEIRDVNISLEEKIAQRTDEQNQLLSLFDRGDVSLFRWKNDNLWKIEYASNNTKMIFGYTKEEFLNEDIIYSNIIHKDDLERVSKEVTCALEKDLDFFTHEPYRVITKDNNEIWVLDNTLVVKDNMGNATHFLGYISDITALKESELEIKDIRDRFQLAIEGSKDGLWDWNIITNEIYFSVRWKEMLGYRDDEIKADLEEYSSRVHPDDMKKVFLDVKAHIHGKTEVYESIYRMKHKDGSWRWILARGKVLIDSKGNATRMVGFHTDITRNKELEENLQYLVQEKTQENLKQREMLREQSKMAAIGEMIGAIAHQWRQPLNALSINIQNLEYDFEDGIIDKEFIKEFVEKNNKTIGFMSSTIDDFRNFFRVDKEKDFFSIKEAVESSISMQSAQLKNHSITLYLEGDDFEVNGYKSEFQQVILNIINNAQDALMENNIRDPKIEIRLENGIVSIKDNAGGIPKDIIDRVFEPYFTTKEYGQGTGLGLYMSKMIIEDNIEAKLKVSNVDDGAMFTIDFR
jgi:PAS domain S-box-containing protein